VSRGFGTGCSQTSFFWPQEYMSMSRGIVWLDGPSRCIISAEQQPRTTSSRLKMEQGA
jgi:hypothetical protein